jgi:MYXO-CTERM domain-containing protein
VGVAVAVDSQDNAYVVGTTYSNNFPVTADAFQSVCSPIAADFNFNTLVNEGKKAGCAGINGGGEYIYGEQDIFLVKLNPAGSQILYGTFLGGSQNDVPDGVALDAAGNIYVSGSTSSASTGTFAQSGQFNYPVTASAFQSLGVPGSFVTFITVLSGDGHSLLYSSVIGGIDTGTSGNGPPGNTGSALAVNPATGIAYIAGFSRSATFPVTAGALQATCPADTNGACPETAFVAAFDPTKAGAASLVYSTRLNGTVPALPTTHVNGIAVDSTGNAYLTGTTQANDFPTTVGALQPACSHVNPNGCNDAFVTKINPTGTTAVWSTLYGSPSGCCTVSGSAITVDANRNVYVAGINGGAFDLAQKAPIPAVEHGNQDVFLLELNAAGSQILFGSYFGGTGNDVPSGIAVDSNANIFVAGQTGSADIPVSANAFDKALSGGFGTGFVAMVSTVGGAVDAGADTVGDAGAGDAGAKDAAVGDAKGIDAVTVGSSEASAAVDAGSAGGDAPAPSDAVSKNPGGSKQGCGCRIASTEPPAATLWLLAVGFLLLARRRR